MLLISCGFTISHVYCPNGEQWVMGAEMPPCNSSEDESSCCKSKNGCVKVPEKKRDNRKKDTYEFKFDVEGKQVSTSETGIVNNTFELYSISLLDSSSVFSKLSCEIIEFGFHPPPDILNPDLSKLQVFRI